MLVPNASEALSLAKKCPRLVIQESAVVSWLPKAESINCFRGDRWSGPHRQFDNLVHSMQPATERTEVSIFKPYREQSLPELLCSITHGEPDAPIKAIADELRRRHYLMTLTQIDRIAAMQSLRHVAGLVLGGLGNIAFVDGRDGGIVVVLLNGDRRMWCAHPIEAHDSRKWGSDSRILLANCDLFTFF